MTGEERGVEYEEREPWRDSYQNALAALRMIRETLETAIMSAANLP
jgi:hypothetical protein